MLKGAIFDLDGTILDSMFIWDTIGEDVKMCIATVTDKQAADWGHHLMPLYKTMLKNERRIKL